MTTYTKSAFLSIVLIMVVQSFVQGQSLTFDELIKINTIDFVSVDEYLSPKGWILEQMPPKKDSIIWQAWLFDSHYNGSKIKSISEVTISCRYGETPTIRYATSDRRYFDAIKTRCSLYKMEQQGVISNDDGIGSLYYGANYQLEILISPLSDEKPTRYSAMLQRHGLTKMYTEADDGTFKPEWRKLIVYGWKAFKDEGAIIRAQPNDSSKILQQVPKGELVIIPEGDSQECLECGENYYRASFNSDEIKPIELGVPLGSKGYILKSDLRYGKLKAQ